MNVSYHVKRLVELRCAELVEIGTVRGAIEHFYQASVRVDLNIEPIARTATGASVRK